MSPQHLANRGVSGQTSLARWYTVGRFGQFFGQVLGNRLENPCVAVC